MLINVGRKKKKGITLHHCGIWTEGKQNEMEVGRGVSAIAGKNVGLILSDNFVFFFSLKTTKNKSYFQVCEKLVHFTQP